jgi:hypothetical protein
MATSTLTFSEKLALFAGTASLAANPVTAKAAAILGAGGPLMISQTDANGTVVNWDVDGDSNTDFQLRLRKQDLGSGNFYDAVYLQSQTIGSAQLNGRGFVGTATSTWAF